MPPLSPLHRRLPKLSRALVAAGALLAPSIALALQVEPVDATGSSFVLYNRLVRLAALVAFLLYSLPGTLRLVRGADGAPDRARLLWTTVALGVVIVGSFILERALYGILPPLWFFICGTLFWIIAALIVAGAILIIIIVTLPSGEQIAITSSAATIPHDPNSVTSGIALAALPNITIRTATSEPTHFPMLVPTIGPIEQTAPPASGAGWIPITSGPTISATAGSIVITGSIGGAFTPGMTQVRFDVTASCARGHSATETIVLDVT